jgi:Icc-related predicted phosphoesterase
MKLIAITDIHGDLRHLPLLLQEEFDLLLVCGDLTDLGGEDSGVEVLNQLASLNRPMLGVHGNCDKPAVLSLLENRDISLHGLGKRYSGVGFFGAGGSNATPFGTPSEYSEEELERALEVGHSMVARTEVKVMVSHAPPLETNCDRITSGQHVGSSAVRSAIEKFKPQLVLTGHIHESVAADQIGPSLVLNPGMFPNGGYVRAEIKDGKIRTEFMRVEG